MPMIKASKIWNKLSYLSQTPSLFVSISALYYMYAYDVKHNTGVTFTFWTPYVSFIYTDKMQKKQQVLYTTVNIELCALIQIAFHPNVINDR